MQEAKIPPAVTCLRCGHKWIPRVPLVRICAKCKSAQWDVIRVPFDIPPEQVEPEEENQKPS